mgnify:CR=1 FL=1
MKAVFYEGTGGPEVIEVREVQPPVPKPGEVIVDVVAAGLNRADVQQRRGVYPPPPGASELPGLEVSGTVSALGGAPIAGASVRVGLTAVSTAADGSFALSNLPVGSATLSYAYRGTDPAHPACCRSSRAREVLARRSCSPRSKTRHEKPAGW